MAARKKARIKTDSGSGIKERKVFLEDQKVTLNEVENFLSIHHAKPADKLMVIISANLDFYTAISSPIGQELLKEIMDLMGSRLTKIIENTASDEERVEYKVLKKIFEDWLKRISAYLAAVNTIKQTL